MNHEDKLYFKILYDTSTERMSVAIFLVQKFNLFPARQPRFHLRNEDFLPPNSSAELFEGYFQENGRQQGSAALHTDRGYVFNVWTYVW